MLVDIWEASIAQVAAVAKGAIVTSGTYAPTYYNEPEGKWQTTSPTVPVGSTIGINVLGQNTATYRQWMQMLLTIYDPDGVAVIGKLAGPSLIEPGAYIGSGGFTTITKKIGTYSVLVELHAEPA